MFYCVIKKFYIHIKLHVILEFVFMLIKKYVKNLVYNKNWYTTCFQIACSVNLFNSKCNTINTIIEVFKMK